MRDSQKQKLYDWERRFTNQLVAEGRDDLVVDLPLDVCQRFVNKIFDTYGIKPPTVKKHRYNDGATAHFWSFDYTITLPLGWAVLGWIVAHEAAHGLVSRLFGYGVASHGPEFCRVYANVLARFLNIDASRIEASMKEAGLKVLDSSPLPKEYIQARPSQRVREAAPDAGTAFAKMMAGVKTYGNETRTY